MKTAILTGANGNLGRDFINTLIANNYAIYAVDKNIDQLNSEDNITPIKLDITNENEVKDFYQKIDKLDLIVNNAGIGVFSSFEERTAEEFRLVTDVNLLGTFLMAQGAIKIMKSQNHGKIVNIASIYGLVSPDQNIYKYKNTNGNIFYKPVAYSASKSGVLNLTRYLATYWAKQNIRVNTLTIAGVFNNQDDEFLEEYCNRIPIGRMAEQDDYNGALLFLASNQSAYMTGSNLIIDGGWTAI